MKKNYTPIGETKTCTSCHIEQDLSEFRPGHSHGRPVTLNRCRTCVNIAQKENRERRHYNLGTKRKELQQEKLAADFRECSICKETKFMTEFPKSKETREGRRNLCSECTKAKQRRKYARHREDMNLKSKEWNDKNKEKSYFIQRKSNLKRHYNITLEDYEIILKSQNGVCAICKRLNTVQKGQRKQLCVDHNHESGCIRGLLCDACNRAIGNLQDSVEVLQAAIEYIKSDGSNLQIISGI